MTDGVRKKFLRMWSQARNDQNDVHLQVVYNYGVQMVRMFPNENFAAQISVLRSIEEALELPRKVFYA